TFTNGSTPVSSVWDFGDGSTSEDINATHVYTAPGNYNVKLVNTYTQCKDSVTMPVVITGNPAASFTALNVAGCQAPLTTNFTSTSPAATSWNWDFGDGGSSTDPNPAHTYTRTGNFDVKLSVTSRFGCVGSATRTGFVNIQTPTVQINQPRGGCIPYSLVPAATINAPDGVRDYLWDYGGGITRTGASPAPVVYTTAGTFPLTLTITTNGGCTISTTLPNAVRTGTPSNPTFTATPTDICAAGSVHFTNTTAVSDEWLWEFGDNATSDAQNPTHRFTDTGSFMVRLIAFNNRCPDTSAFQLIHVKPPVASFLATVDCTTPHTVVITNESKTDPAYGPITYNWDFGDPSVTNPTNVHSPGAISYPGLGPYTIRLTVTNGTCSQTMTRTVSFISDPANFSISANSVCVNELITLTANPVNPSLIAGYYWFMNGAPVASSSSRTAQVRRPTAGNYTVQLQMHDVSGCVHISSSNPVITVRGPRARFRPASRIACKNAPVGFTDQTVSASPLISWNFDFGDGKTQRFTAPPFTHTFTDTGKFVVKMTVTDNGNCSDTYETTDTIHVVSPVSGFKAEYTTICPGSNLQFTDTSLGAPTRWRWEFGDGSSATTQNPVYVYRGNDGDAFNVKLVVTDVNGCSDSAIANSYITLKRPRPAFDIEDTTTICPPLETKFTLTAQDYESFYWDFGDGGASSLDNPSHFYNGFGTYTAKLYVYGIGGCLDSASRTVRVIDPAATTNIGYSATRACDTLTVDFTITTPDYTAFTFQYGDGATDNTQSKNLRHRYNTPNNYRPALTLRDSVGCQVLIGGRSTIQILGAEVIFGMDKNKFCDAGEIFFTDFTRPRQDPILSRTWDFGDGATTTAPNPSHRYTQPGTYYPKLVVVTDFGCNSTLVDTVRVYRTPEPVILGNAVVCLNNELLLDAATQVADTAITWKWEPGIGAAGSTAGRIGVKYGQTGTFPVRLEATNLLGCKGNTMKEITVPPLPEIRVAEDPVIPVGGSITLPVSYTGNIVNYSWIPSSNLSCDDCPNPVASPKYTTKYMIQVTDDNGCKNTSGITVNVQCNDKNYFVPNTFSPNNDGRNDRFYPRGSSITRIQSMKIFNRWGEQLFEKRNFSANDPSAGWDGTIKGKPANPDIYIYVVEFICENAAIVPLRGNVMLVR
ncbi:MAG: PKD domain-containing protein, partial [Pseudobacter sp.]|uniref:PKD domain-containing protein n=1 Tax=Pseudobacter sp. TaxID=2045420 RepID=UPI003F7D2E8C